MILHWYCKEKLCLGHPQELKGYWALWSVSLVLISLHLNEKRFTFDFIKHVINDLWSLSSFLPWYAWLSLVTLKGKNSKLVSLNKQIICNRSVLLEDQLKKWKRGTAFSLKPLFRKSLTRIPGKYNKKNESSCLFKTYDGAKLTPFMPVLALITRVISSDYVTFCCS